MKQFYITLWVRFDIIKVSIALIVILALAALIYAGVKLYRKYKKEKLTVVAKQHIKCNCQNDKCTCTTNV